VEGGIIGKQIRKKNGGNGKSQKDWIKEEKKKFELVYVQHKAVSTLKIKN